MRQPNQTSADSLRPSRSATDSLRIRLWRRSRSHRTITKRLQDVVIRCIAPFGSCGRRYFRDPSSSISKQRIGHRVDESTNSSIATARGPRPKANGHVSKPSTRIDTTRPRLEHESVDLIPRHSSFLFLASRASSPTPPYDCLGRGPKRPSRSMLTQSALTAEREAELTSSFALAGLAFES